MTLTVTGRHLVVSEAVRALIERKMAHVDKLLGGSAVSAQCVVSRERQQFVFEATVHARGDHQLHAVARHGRLATAVAAVGEKISQQAHKLSDRWKTKKRDGGNSRARGLQDEAEAAAEPGTPDFEPRVIRARRAIRPMTVDDAVIALSASRDSLIVFRQAPSEAVTVLYRRPDGHFGLIESEA